MTIQDTKTVRFNVKDVKNAQAALEAAQALVDLSNKEPRQPRNKRRTRRKCVLMRFYLRLPVQMDLRAGAASIHSTAVVAQRGLFRILLGNSDINNIAVTNIDQKAAAPAPMAT